MQRFVIAVVFALSAACALEVKHLREDVDLAILSDRVYPTWQIKGDSHAWVGDAMLSLITEKGFVVSEADSIVLNGETYVAITNLGTRQMVIRKGIPGNMKASTLIHEWAHTLAPLALPNGEQEAWAEGVAFLTCKRLGLDTWQESVSYLAQVPAFQRRATWEKFGGEMSRVADFLAGEIKVRRAKPPTALP